MRIVAGTFRSRQLKSLKGLALRPTSDRLRETLFNILGARVEGSRFLDLFAGSGAIGIEAISRGAATVYFADQSRKACQMIRQNLSSLEIREGFKILEMDLEKALRTIETPFDIAFVDPPYDSDDVYTDVLQWFGASPRLSAMGLLILEHSKRKDLPESAGALSPRDRLAARACAQIDRYLEDSEFRFDLPIAFQGTSFQRRVWKRISAIDAGLTRSYGEIARELGSSPRAVGQACGANPVPLVVPCHRVLAAGGLGGFAHHERGFHLAVKRWLLAHEGSAGRQQ